MLNQMDTGTHTNTHAHRDPYAGMHTQTIMSTTQEEKGIYTVLNIH